jgi:hypothetical protein
MNVVKESWVKGEVKKILKAKGIWYFMPNMNGLGRAGIPDFICSVGGALLGIETKAGKNKPTDLQLNEIHASLDVLPDLIDSILQLRKADGHIGLSKLPTT